MFSKKQLLSAFLELDNVKLVVSEGTGKKASRVYAGQINFTPDIVRDAFIVDSAKFANQVKVALTQKPQLQAVSDVQIIFPPEKTFIKTLEPSESVESFLRILPFFKEELVLQSEVNKKNQFTTNVAFEKKLVEELSAPFLDSGKKILRVCGSAALLAAVLQDQEDQFLFMSFDKSIAVLIWKGGKIVQLEAWPPDVFAGRFVEFVHNAKLEDIKKASVLGNISQEALSKLQTDLGIVSTVLDASDIYDQVISGGQVTTSGGSKLSFQMPSVSLPSFENLPAKKFIVLGVAILLGFGITFGAIALYQNMNKGKNVSPVAQKKTDETTKQNNSQPVSQESSQSAVQKPTVVEMKPSEVKIRILNGTSVSGEAGRLKEKLVALGFNVTETKNATSAGFVSTRLRVVAGVPDSIVTILKTEIAKTYESITQEVLVDPTVKAEVIIGKKL